MMGAYLFCRCYRSFLTLGALPFVSTVLVSSEKAPSVSQAHFPSEGNREQRLTVPRALRGLGSPDGRGVSVGPWIIFCKFAF